MSGAAATAPAASSSTDVYFRVTGKVGIPAKIPDMSKPGSTTIAALQAFFQKKLKTPVVHVFVLQGSEGFIPTPDQTLETLRGVYAFDEDGKSVLSLAVSTQIFQG